MQTLITLLLSLCIFMRSATAEEKIELNYDVVYTGPFDGHNTFFDLSSSLHGVASSSSLSAQVRGQHIYDNIGHLTIAFQIPYLLLDSQPNESNELHHSWPETEFGSPYRFSAVGNLYILTRLINDPPRVVVHSEYEVHRVVHYYVEIDEISPARILTLRGGIDFGRHLFHDSDHSTDFTAVSLNGGEDISNFTSDNLYAGIGYFALRAGIGSTRLLSYKLNLDEDDERFDHRVGGRQQSGHRLRTLFADVLFAPYVGFSNVNLVYEEGEDFSEYDINSESSKSRFGFIIGVESSTSTVVGNLTMNYKVKGGRLPGPASESGLNNSMILLSLGIGTSFMADWFS